MCISAPNSGPIQRWAATAALCLVAASCALGPDFERPAPPQVKSFLSEHEATGVPAQAPAAPASPHGAWWKPLGNPAIDALVDESLRRNPGLAASEASLRESRELLQAGYGALIPNLDLGASATRQLPSAFRTGTALPVPAYTLYSALASASYVVDVFGGARRQIEALGADVDASRESAAATRLALEGSVVSAAIAVSTFEEEEKSLQPLRAARAEELRLIRVEETAGLVPYSVVDTAVANLANAEAALQAVENEEAAARHQVAVFTGRYPGEFDAPLPRFGEIADAPLAPEIVPSMLVERRPDVLVAEAQWHAACAQVGVSTANLFPNVSLSASAGNANPDWSRLSGAQSRFWSAGVNLDLPVLQAYANWHRREAAIAAWDEAQAQYRSIVLNAFRQVADALQTRSHDGTILAIRVEQRDSARRTLAAARANYSAGRASHFDLLESEVAAAQAEVLYVDARAQYLQDEVALTLALGGTSEAAE